MIKKSDIKIALFGTSLFSTLVFKELLDSGYEPSVIVTAPDRPKGRGLVPTAPPAALFARRNNIDVLQPEKLDADVTGELGNTDWDIFVVASYGRIIPSNVIGVPTRGSLNVHPSLLPKFRGASPIQTSILEDSKETGVTIIQMDEEMDHGPIVAQSSITPADWPIRADVLEKLLAHEGGKLLSDVIPRWIDNKIDPEEQRHNGATYTKKFSKKDGELDLAGNGYQNYLRYCALYGSIGTYFFTDKSGKNIRVKISDATYDEGRFLPLRVIPEGKKEIGYEVFLTR
jgi:methionyl-tRNA formyltransferase